MTFKRTGRLVAVVRGFTLSSAQAVWWPLCADLNRRAHRAFTARCARFYTVDVQARCTCGAVLPEDARFCHKCGKPQNEEDMARLLAEETAARPVPPPIPATAPPGTGISFKNARAVSISIVVAIGTLLVSAAVAVFVPLLFPVLLCGAGFLAARLYNGRATQPLSPAGGARLGWMTGLWLFLIFLVMFALVAVAISNPEVLQQAQASWARLPQTGKLSTLSQHDLLMQLVTMLPLVFFMVTLLPGLGGMLGAKLSRRSHS